jgi:crossover junction endodeoxyribonuclease RuvC
VAVERVFSQSNVRTVMGTAQAGRRRDRVRRPARPAGRAAHAVGGQGRVTGSGRADKDQVGTMVARLLRLDGPPRPADAADALALAICHLWRAPAQARLAAAVAGARR